MPNHIALLRGINLGGHRRVAMADLRALAGSLGFTEVATYIQSGNLVFTADGPDGADTAALAATLEQGIATTLGVPARVVVLTRDELAQAIRDNPYPDETNPKCLHALFLTGEPDADTASRIADAQRRAAERGGRDTARVIGRTIFLHTPDGFGRSDLAAQLTKDRKGAKGGDGVTATARNWATVVKLLAMCDAEAG